MGTISDKTTYLNTTKAKIREKINDLGQDLDEEDTFRSYAEVLEQVWNEYPKVTATDVEEASINGTKTGRMEIDLKGQTSQATTILPLEYQQVEYIQSSGVEYIDSGYQLNSNTSKIILKFKTINGLNYYKCLFGYENDYINRFFLRFHPDNSGHFYTPNNYTINNMQIDNINNIEIDIFNNKTKCNGTEIATSIKINNSSLPLFIFTLNYQRNPASDNFSTMQLYTFQVYENNNIVRNLIPCYRKSDNEIGLYDTITNTFLTNAGTGTFAKGNDVTLPNPDFPQQIKNVTGNANVKIQNKNLFDEENATIKLDFAKDDNGNEIGNISGNYTTTYTKVFPNTRYTFSYNLSSTVVRIYYYNEEKSWISRTSNIKSSSNNYTFTTPSNCCYLQFQNVINFGTAQLEQGTTATTYVAHQEQNYPFSLKSKNLFDKDSSNIIQNQYLLPAGNTGNNQAFAISDYISVLENTQYSLQPYRNLGSAICFYDENKTFLSGIQLSQANPNFTTPASCKYLRISFQKADKDIEQLEQGTTPTDYEPYYDIKAMEGTTLEDDGIHNTRTHITLDGTENITLSTATVGTSNYGKFDITINKRTITSSTKVVSSHFLYKFQGWTSAGNENTFSFTSPTILRLLLDINEFDSIETLRTFLVNNKVTFEIILETEETISYQGVQQAQYNAIKQAKSYDDQTNISQTYDELPFILDIEALKGETTNEVNLLTRNNRKTAEYLESSLEPEEVEKLEEERVDTEENTESTAENAENSAESEEK